MHPELPGPTRPRALASTVSEDGDVIAVSIREGTSGRAWFLGLWLAGWTVGCIGLAYAACTRPEPFLLVFGIPFWASWAFVAVVLANTLFGRHRVSLDPDGLASERRLPGMTTRRFVPLSELRSVAARVFAVDSEGSETAGIEIGTLGRSLVIGTGLSAVERDWLADRLDRHRRRLQAAAGREQPAEIDPGDCRTLPPPTDCAWSHQEDDFDGPLFLQRGHLDAAAVFGLLFVAVFWNGIVGVFVASLAGLDRAEAAPRDAAWWGLFLFLIPFEVVGLAVVVGLLAAVLDPVRVTRWRFGRDAITRVTTWAGLPLGWSRRFTHAGLATAAVRDDLAPRGPFGLGAAPGIPSGANYGLLVADAANVEVCRIAGLTLGEARWMKGRLQAAGLVR